MPSILLGVAKRPKDGVGESGDSVEVVERPRGGYSVVLVDGQGSGPGAKRTSHHITNRAAALVAEGARDGAVMRAMHDALYALRDGRVSAVMTLLSVDLEARSIVVSQGGEGWVVVQIDGEEPFTLIGSEQPFGVHVRVRPRVTTFPLDRPITVVACTDGVIHAGRRLGKEPFGAEGVKALLTRLVSGWDAQRLAEAIVAAAVAADDGRARDDMAAVVLAVVHDDRGGGLRTLALESPFR